MNSSAHPFTKFSGARVAVTGGLGFIGSTLARRLVALGADVVVLDCKLPLSGANPFNLDGVSGRLTVVPCDILDARDAAHAISPIAGISSTSRRRPATRAR